MTPETPTAPDVPPAIAHVTEYAVSCLSRRHPSWWYYAVRLIERAPNQWVVRAESELRDVNGRPVEPHVEGEDFETWRSRHRFDFETALDIAKKLAPTLVVNGVSVADVLARAER